MIEAESVIKLTEESIRVNKGKKTQITSYTSNGVPRTEDEKVSSYLIDVSKYVGKTIHIHILNYMPYNWYEGAVLNENAQMDDFENLPINNQLPQDNFVNLLFLSVNEEEFVITPQMKWVVFSGDINIYPDVYIIG